MLRLDHQHHVLRSFFTPNWTMLLAIMSTRSGENTPMYCPSSFKGLANGPIMLKIVGTPRFFLTCMTFFIEGWASGAYMKDKPTTFNWFSMFSGVAWIFTPNSCRTSALPHRLEIDRLPCLAMFRPAPAKTKAQVVEILKVSAPSPPVPTIS